MNNATLLAHINDFIEDEHRLQAAGSADSSERVRHIDKQLEPCWDLPRQRCAKRQFGRDPDAARPGT